MVFDINKKFVFVYLLGGKNVLYNIKIMLRRKKGFCGKISNMMELYTLLFIYHIRKKLTMNYA